ncbi:esterase/lipase family protein [Desulfosudis oleivorans]|uniref:Alpha/beta hydrolase fold n=1 Tax=Desulfosudis oleivorans (strain DSM 6200 / JCM 39069 / Hxd3) TaxID=96561 RepID=A8ZXJ2_DESOH|nr:alpha/beta fold hydrolase [Desulfosudis oleivorans]ABW66950.1 alpha/beta hydrolase fold [Desulfosudis oleivorans Hxd3]
MRIGNLIKTTLIVLLFALTTVLFSNAAFARGSAPPPPDEYTKTAYPMVLVHGSMGFDNTDILGFIDTDYWPTIPYEVMRSGGTVYVAQVSALNSPEVRGEQLIHELEFIKALKGHKKFNLIGHSFGAPTSRYVAAVRPDLVASVSSVGGSNDTDDRDNPNPPNPPDAPCGIDCQLTELIFMDAGGIRWTVPQATSDVDSELASLREAARVSRQAVNSAYALYGFPIDVSADNSFDERKEYFNRVYSIGRPDCWGGQGAEVGENGVGYYSWSGTQVLTNPLDPSDAALFVAAIAGTLSGEPPETDGLVNACESHWGKVIRDNYPMNHLDETNLLWGLTNPFFNEVELYRQHANRLKKAGY